MRSNVIQMMDRIGLPRVLGIGSTASLWAADSNLVQFTSALRYPVFVDGANWSGTPDMVGTAKLREWLIAYTGAELATLPDAVIVPLGLKVSAAMYHLAQRGAIDESRILDGMPHPSGANAERIAYFLGRKQAHECSSKTNPTRLDDARGVDRQGRPFITTNSGSDIRLHPTGATPCPGTPPPQPSNR